MFHWLKRLPHICPADTCWPKEAATQQAGQKDNVVNDVDAIDAVDLDATTVSLVYLLCYKYWRISTIIAISRWGQITTTQLEVFSDTLRTRDCYISYLGDS